ncbi:phage lytic cycle repressor MrpR family protein [Paenibacillus glucanolyticus]
MSNKIYESGFYNEEQKLMFLKGLKSNTLSTFSRVLNRAKMLEEQYKKDLYDFNIYEIERLISYLNPKTMNSVLSSASIIQNYIRWAIEEDLRINNLNPLDAIFGQEYYSKFVDKTNKMIFSKEEIDDITGGLVNFQDSAIIQSIFEGILGKGYSEVLNLTIHDINQEDSSVLLRNNRDQISFSERTLELTQELVIMLNNAFQEEIYYKNNGNPAANIKAPTSKLVRNEYIFRSAILNTKANGKADSHLILRRLKKIGEWYQQPFLTAINIRNSGMVYMAHQLRRRTGKFDKETFDIVCDRFNISKIKNSSDYNASRIRNDFLNIDKIIEVYGEE